MSIIDQGLRDSQQRAKEFNLERRSDKKPFDHTRLLDGHGMELNPRHPAVNAMHDHWHKMAGLIMHKLGVNDIQFSGSDVEEFGRMFPDDRPSVVIGEKDGVLRVRLLPEKEAVRLAREEGSL